MSLPPLDDGGAGDDEPESTRGGPPHPMDRVWRHPSELPALSEPSTGPGTRNGSTAPTGLRSILAPLGAGAIGALLTVAVLAAAGVFDHGGVTGVLNRATGTTRASDAIATITARIAPAIVAVRVVGKSGSRSGSGVCIRHAGQVLTSNRLVADARRIEVVTSDGTLRTARVIGNDPASDLALLTIDGQLEAADLATPRSLRIGDPVYAVGADSWVSTGIVSSLDGVVANDGPTMSGLIETNAVTEPALAGGALLDNGGRVVGIIMTTVSGHPATIAVPILLASQIADRLRADGRVDHGWLGVAGKASSGQVFVTKLAPGGPSQRAGIHVGDIVVKVDSQPISTMNDLMAAARGHWPGDRIHIEVTRDRTDLTISVRLARMPRTSAPPPSATTTVTSATTVTSTTAQP